MNAFSRGKHKNKSIYVPLRSGGLAQRSTGTPSKTITTAMKNLVVKLRDDERWVLLEAVTVKPYRLTLLDLYRANASNALDALELSLSAVRLADVRDAWLASVQTRLGGSEDERSSVQNYGSQFDTFAALHPDGTVADLTPDNVTLWLASRTKATPGTRRKYVYALKSLIAYLIEAKKLKTDPLAGYRMPKKNAKRERWETEANDKAIVDAALPKYRAAFAFIKATGCDAGTVRRTLVRDLDLPRGKALIRGTKTNKRMVHEGDIEAWAIPYLTAFVTDKLPNTLLWPELTNSGMSHHHERCCAAVGVEDYTLKDARHSVAVRMRFAGKDFEDIAEQLGNSPAICADTYARFKASAPAAIAGKLKAVR